MLQFIVRRSLIALITIFVISVMSFIIIQLPPGDFLTSYVASLAEQGTTLSGEQVEILRETYGLNQPIWVQYYKWMQGVVVGDFGRSLEWEVPIADLIWDRLAMSILIGASSIFFVWSLAIPIGVYSATNQYSLLDYISTFFGFLGLAIPNFMLALILMWIAFSQFGQDVGGLYSPEYQNAPWSIAKFIDLLKTSLDTDDCCRYSRDSRINPHNACQYAG